MKKVLFFSLVLFFLTNCKDPGKSEDNTTTKNSDSAGVVDSVTNRKNLAQQNPVKVADNEKFGYWNIISTPEAKGYIKKFQEEVADHDSRFTKSILFDKEVFIELGKFLDTTTKNIKYVKIYVCQYNTFVAQGQNVRDQFSVVIVPARPNKTPDWDAITMETAKNFKFLGGLNHGELCPIKCVE